MPEAESKGKVFMAKGHMGSLKVMEKFVIMTFVVVPQACKLIKTHQTIQITGRHYYV